MVSGKREIDWKNSFWEGIMEKEKKIKKFLLAILLGILWCIVGSIFNFLFCAAAVYPYIFSPYEIFLVEGYFMVMIIYYFHQTTNKMWTNYLESGLLLVFCIVEGWFLYMDRQGFDSIVVLGDRFMPICIMAVLVSFFLNKWKQGQAILYKIEKMNKSVCIILFGFFCYLGTIIIGGFIFDYQLLLKILSIIIIFYIIIARKILKREYRWKLFRAYISVFIILFFKVCLMQVSDIYVYGYCDFEDFLMSAIPYGIAVAIGELIAWLSDKRKDSRLAEQEAEDMESDWYLRF